MSLGFAILLFLHLVSAIGWMGAGIVFAMLIGPILPSLSPASRGELIVKLFPKYIRYAEVLALTTPIFGLALALYISHGSWDIFNPAQGGSSAMYLSLGALLSLVLWGVVFGLIAPSGNKVVWFTKEMMKAPGTVPPAGLLKASNRMRLSATVALVLMAVVVICMVAFATGG